MRLLKKTVKVNLLLMLKIVFIVKLVILKILLKILNGFHLKALADLIIQICNVKNLSYLLPLFFLISSCSDNSDENVFEELMQSEWQRGIDENPLYASSMGNLDKNDQWPEYSVEKIKTNYEHDLKILTQLNQLNSDAFSDDNLLNLQLFKDQYINSTELYQFKSFLMPFSHRGGIQLQHESAETLPLRSVKHYEDWLSRLSKIDNYIDSHINVAKAGMANNIMPPRILMQRVLDQIKAQAFSTAKDSPFNKAFIEMPSSINIEDKQRIQNEATEIIQKTVIPAYIKLYNFFNSEYLPMCRDSIGINKIPNGAKYYEALTKKFTTTQLHPDEVHQIGLDEVARIKTKMLEIVEEVKWDGSF